ncbi:MAG: thioesterase family protein [Solirubrobacteraceae bacterium]
MSADPLFVRDGERFVPSDATRGPWDPGALHGGAPAALFVHAFEGLIEAPGLQLARLTCEFVRPVPLAPLSVRTEVLRPGRRVTLLEARIEDEPGVEVARARALYLTASDIGDTLGGPPPFPGPQTGRPNDFEPGHPMFATHAMEIRFVEGAFREVGSATAWFRLRGPLVADAPLSPFELVAAAGDFGNGIASELSWGEHMFINPDLTLYLERAPRGDWVALQSEMRVGPGSVAVAESVLWDEAGRIGRAIQALLVGRR